MEGLLGVNLVLRARTIVVVPNFVLCVLYAGTPTVALTVEAIAVWRVAGMYRSLRNKHICLHNVVLWAIVTTYLICITVVVAVCVPVLTIAVLARSANQVKGGNTTTV